MYATDIINTRFCSEGRKLRASGKEESRWPRPSYPNLFTQLHSTKERSIWELQHLTKFTTLRWRFDASRIGWSYDMLLIIFYMLSLKLLSYIMEVAQWEMFWAWTLILEIFLACHEISNIYQHYQYSLLVIYHFENASHFLKLSGVESLKGGQALPIPRPQLRASHASRGTYFGLWRKAC